MSETGLKCKNIQLSYPDFTLNVDFSINKGELVSIIGPSGSGKSSLLGIISGLKAADSGCIEIQGSDVTSKRPEERKAGLVLHGYALFPHMDAEENIAYPMKARRLSKEQVKAETRRLTELVRLSGHENRHVRQLSEAEQFKVSLARALASEPAVLLLDDPLSGMESKVAHQLRTEIREVQKKTGITMLYVTNDQEEALSISDKVMILNQGRIEQYGTPEDIYRRPCTEFAASFTGECNILPYDVILRTLRVPETERSKVIYQCFGPEHRLLFRPEDMVVNDMPGLPFPEFYPHLRFENAKVLRTEYHGKEYLVTVQYDELTLKAYTVYKPASDTITIGIRMTRILEYNNGKLTRH